MNASGWIEILVFFVALILAAKPLGLYMANVLRGERTLLSPVLLPLERGFYRLAGVDPDEEMGWKTYCAALLLFSLGGVLILYVILRLPQPAGVSGMDPWLALNTAVSFVTNTNWQNYAGETTLGPLAQMLGLTVQNFLSAAVGVAICAAFMRALARASARTIGNFWADLTRATLYIFLPLALALGLVLVALGGVQTLATGVTVQPVQAGSAPQTLALGPVASQVAIKHLGTNGGGFFNANAAHPFEDPNALSAFLLLLAQTIIPAGLAYTFGIFVGDRRQGWAILAAMLILLLIFSGLGYAAEAGGNPLLPGSANNMEGKEQRFGVALSSLFETVTTATSTGAVISAHDSYTPLGGMVQLLMMQLGEVVLGGVGSGLYGMLVFVLVAVFVAGLMVGRTPEYLGKKIEPYEMKMAALLVLIMPLMVLGLSALATVLDAGRASVSNPGPHGFSQILYAFTSMGNNNGSAFAGLNGNTPFYNVAGALAMLVGRFWLAVPTLALAGSLAAKKKAPAGAGTLATHSPLFIAWLIAVILIVGALNFIPALALGPLAEHLMMIGG